MKAWDVIAYAYEADTHCAECASKAGMTAEDVVDAEGNGVGVVFADQMSDYPDGLWCGDCLAELIKPEATA